LVATPLSSSLEVSLFQYSFRLPATLTSIQEAGSLVTSPLLSSLKVSLFQSSFIFFIAFYNPYFYLGDRVLICYSVFIELGGFLFLIFLQALLGNFLLYLKI
jgi:hypothetical protein